ncbi:MAG: cation transporter [Clostridia bacterium]|nr:cation transporter [Clostridia bacterium]
MKYKLKITGLDCPNCAAKLADMMAAKDGIESAKINFLTEKLTVESELEEDDVMELILAAAKSFDPDVKIAK